LRATEGAEVKDKLKEKGKHCKQNHGQRQTAAAGRGRQSNEASGKKIYPPESSPADNPRMGKCKGSA